MQQPSRKKKQGGRSGISAVSSAAHTHALSLSLSVGHELGPLLHPPGICGGSAGTLGLARTWQVSVLLQCVAACCRVLQGVVGCCSAGPLGLVRFWWVCVFLDASCRTYECSMLHI